jgi:hypothetical protein
MYRSNFGCSTEPCIDKVVDVPQKRLAGYPYIRGFMWVGWTSARTSILPQIDIDPTFSHRRLDHFTSSGREPGCLMQ